MNINEKLQVIIDKQLKIANAVNREIQIKKNPNELHVLKHTHFLLKDFIADLQWIKGNINERSK